MGCRHDNGLFTFSFIAHSRCISVYTLTSFLLHKYINLHYNRFILRSYSHILVLNYLTYNFAKENIEIKPKVDPSLAWRNVSTLTSFVFVGSDPQLWGVASLATVLAHAHHFQSFRREFQVDFLGGLAIFVVFCYKYSEFELLETFSSS